MSRTFLKRNAALGAGATRVGVRVLPDPAAGRYAIVEQFVDLSTRRLDAVLAD